MDPSVNKYVGNMFFCKKNSYLYCSFIVQYNWICHFSLVSSMWRDMTTSMDLVFSFHLIDQPVEDLSGYSRVIHSSIHWSIQNTFHEESDVKYLLDGMSSLIIWQINICILCLVLLFLLSDKRMDLVFYEVGCKTKHFLCFFSAIFAHLQMF